MGESYNGIRTLADLFAVVKIPNKLSGAVVGEQLLYLSSNQVGPRILSLQNKKNFSLSFFYPHPLYHGAAIYPKLLCS